MAPIDPTASDRYRNAVVIDDSSEFQLLAQMMLGYLGIPSVRCFSLASEALPALQDSPPDLVLLDQMMAGMDGISLLRQLRALPTTAKIPVIICTAAINRFLEQEEQLRFDPFTMVLPKPFSVEDLQAALAQFGTTVPPLKG